MSAVYFARPVTFSGPSTIGMYSPTERTAAGRAVGFSISFMVVPSRLCRGLRAAQLVGGELHSLDDLHIAGAAADVAAERGLDLVDARRRVFPEQALGRHDVAGRAIA